ncbi:MAG TPA: metallohydrolase, partial [Alphaproteobacteria bacterium]|nr:metallohydrolase [Alphaproteobacteria bacterium]
GLDAILVKVDATWTAINGEVDTTFGALLIAPLPASDDDEEELLTKNNSSIVCRLKLGSGGVADAGRILLGGDAEVAIWERVWTRNSGNASEYFSYDLLLAPHHCSWHSLSWDSWSELGEEAEVSEDARAALGQPRDGAVIVASSKTISDDDGDPPCIRAKREYDGILDEVRDGVFFCVADNDDEPLE